MKEKLLLQNTTKTMIAADAGPCTQSASRPCNLSVFPHEHSQDQPFLSHFSLIPLSSIICSQNCRSNHKSSGLLIMKQQQNCFTSFYIILQNIKNNTRLCLFLPLIPASSLQRCRHVYKTKSAGRNSRIKRSTGIIIIRITSSSSSCLSGRDQQPGSRTGKAVLLIPDDANMFDDPIIIRLGKRMKSERVSPSLGNSGNLCGFQGKEMESP
jgi:hypothetical protein